MTKLLLATVWLFLLLLAAWPLSLQDRTDWSELSLPQSSFIISENAFPMITNKLLKICRAMAEYEGWNYKNGGGEGHNFATPAWRNHNPGNLKASPFAVGKDGKFAIFVDDNVGFFALVWDIWAKASGKSTTGLTPESTIYEMIKVYSGEPPVLVENYARYVEMRTGIESTTKLKALLKD